MSWPKQDFGDMTHDMCRRREQVAHVMSTNTENVDMSRYR